MATIIRVGGGESIDESYVYLGGHKYQVMSGSFPGSSASALPLDGTYSWRIMTGSGAVKSTDERGKSANGVSLCYVQFQYRNAMDNLYGSAYVSFVGAYGLDASALASADTSNVTVQHWLKLIE